MLILGVETATQAASVSLGTPDGLVAQSMLGPGLPGLTRKHGSFVSLAIKQMLDDADLTPADINGVALCVGPGLFTGLRVGMATAQVLAQTLDIPMVACTTTEIIAKSVPFFDGLICPVIDARRKEVFYGAYRQSHNGAQLNEIWEPARAIPTELAQRLAEVTEPTLVLGNGIQPLLEEAIDQPLVRIHPTPVLPMAYPLIQCAMPKFLEQDTVSAQEIHALYLREPDALLPSNANLIDPAIFIR